MALIAQEQYHKAEQYEVQIEQREASEERAMFVKTERLGICRKGCEVAEPHRGSMGNGK